MWERSHQLVTNCVGGEQVVYSGFLELFLCNYHFNCYSSCYKAQMDGSGINSNGQKINQELTQIGGGGVFITNNPLHSLSFNEAQC